jgi:hypothetical protein
MILVVCTCIPKLVGGVCVVIVSNQRLHNVNYLFSMMACLLQVENSQGHLLITIH